MQKSVCGEVGYFLGRPSKQARLHVYTAILTVFSALLPWINSQKCKHTALLIAEQGEY